METTIEDPDDTIGADGRKKSKKQLEALAKGLGEGRRIISWIWVSSGLAGDGGDEGLNDGLCCNLFSDCSLINISVYLIALRVEWTKARARATRWREEVLLLKEEMRRVLRFLEWKAEWWADKVGGDSDMPTSGVSAGMRAYALQQADLQTSLKKHFIRLWESPLALSDTASDAVDNVDAVDNGIDVGDDGDDDDDDDDEEEEGVEFE